MDSAISKPDAGRKFSWDILRMSRSKPGRKASPLVRERNGCVKLGRCESVALVALKVNRVASSATKSGLVQTKVGRLSTHFRVQWGEQFLATEYKTVHLNLERNLAIRV